MIHEDVYILVSTFNILGYVMAGLPDLVNISLPWRDLGQEGAGDGGHHGGVLGPVLASVSWRTSQVLLLLLLEQASQTSTVHVDEDLALSGPGRIIVC